MALKLTLLEIVQEILSALSSDEVNTIAETVESQQVADIVKNTYYDIMSTHDLYSNDRLIQLEPSGTTSRPTHMYLLDEVMALDTATVMYKVGDTYDTISYLTPRDFIKLVTSRNSTDTNVTSVTDNVSSCVLYIINDATPRYFTSFDNTYLIFDSFDNTVDTTLQKSKTLAYGQVIPSWSMTDSFVPALDAAYFPLLIQESKAMAFVNLQQISNSKVEQRARKLNTNLQSKNLKVGYRETTPNFGRI